MSTNRGRERTLKEEKQLSTLEQINALSKEHGRFLGLVYALLPEVHLFINNGANNSFGARFWIASSYSDPTLSDNDRKTFINANRSVYDPNKESEKQRLIDRTFNAKNISFLRFLNPVKPFYVGLEYLKLSIGSGIDRIFNSNVKHQSTAAKATKAAVQILLLPIELPLILTNRLFDGVFYGVTLIKNKFTGLFSKSSKAKNDSSTNTSQKEFNVENHSKKALSMEEQNVTELKSEKAILKSNSITLETSTLQSNSLILEKATLQANSSQPKNTTQFIKNELAKNEPRDLNTSVSLKNDKINEVETKSKSQPTVFNRLINSSPSFKENILKPHEELAINKKNKP